MRKSNAVHIFQLCARFQCSAYILWKHSKRRICSVRIFRLTDTPTEIWTRSNLITTLWTLHIHDGLSSFKNPRPISERNFALKQNKSNRTNTTCWSKAGVFNRSQNVQNKWIWNISGRQQCLQDNVYSSLPKFAMKSNKTVITELYLLPYHLRFHTRYLTSY